MSHIDTINEGMAAWSAGDTARLAELLTDDFTLEGAGPMPLNKEQFLGLGRATHSAMPDWSFNARDWQESGDVVTVTVQITGTHTGTMPPIMQGFPEVPATGKHIELPVEHFTYTFRGDKLATLKTDAGATGGGLIEFYRQVGVQLPPMG
jgi:ketosteroid isomerase-like protein